MRFPLHPTPLKKRFVGTRLVRWELSSLNCDFTARINYFAVKFTFFNENIEALIYTITNVKEQSVSIISPCNLLGLAVSAITTVSRSIRK